MNKIISFEGCKNVGLRLEVHQTCIYSKKINILMPKVHKTCIYSKKSKKNKNFRLYVGLTGIDELVFDFFDFFEYMQVWWLFTIKIFDFFEYMQGFVTFPYQNVDHQTFFEYMQVW